MKKFISVLFVVLASIIFTSCTSSLGDIGKTMALVNSLEKIGISPDAAIGGIGGILSLAQGKLDPADLSKVMSAFPDSKNIMKEAKKLGVGNVTDMTDLGKTFSKLGLKPTDVTKMIPAVTKYVGSNGGSGAGDIIGGLLK